MKAEFLALVLAAFGATGVAHANAQYRAGFELSGGLPQFATGSQEPGNAGTVAGRWDGNKQIDTRVSARELTSSSGTAPTYSDWRTGGNLHQGTGPAFAFGQSVGYVQGGADTTTGIAEVTFSKLSARLDGALATADGFASATWSRGFVLDAHASFTFSGTAVLGIDGHSSPLDASWNFSHDGDPSSGTLSFADAANRVRTSIGATFDGFGSLLPAGIFSYSATPDGFLSLTITNNSDVALRGALQAGSYVNVAAPVPEAETFAMLLLGVAGVAGVARRRKVQADAPTA